MISKLITRRMSSGNGIGLGKVVEFLEKFAGSHLAEEWDNTGLLVEPQTATPVRTVLLTNDLTENVAAEAIQKAAQLIISYHPPIFGSLKRITTQSWKERVIGVCIENKIAVYSPHTRWDAVIGGVNDWLLSPFELKEVEPILKKDEVWGCGRVGKLRNELTLRQVIEKAKTLTKVPSVRLAIARNASLDTPVRTLGVCAGSGSSLITKAPVDVFLTGELQHHVLLNAAHNGTSVLLFDHSNSERGYLSVFATKLSSEFPSIQVLVSDTDEDPIGQLVTKL